MIKKPRALNFKPLPGAQVKLGHPLARGLIVCLPINEMSGGPPKDLISPAAQVTFTGAITWVRAIKINQSGGGGVYVNLGIPDKLKFTNSTSWTIYIVASVDGGAGTVRNLIRSDPGTGSPRPGLALRLEAANTLNSFWGDIAGTAGACTSATTVSVSVGALRHFALVRDVNLDTGKLYLDGVLDTSATDASTSAFTLSNGFQTRFEFTPGEYWNGDYSAIYIWKRALSATEIAVLYKDPYIFFEKPFIPAFDSGNPLQTIDVSDDLNSPWQDAIASPAAPQSASDTIQNWSDAVAIDYFAPATPQTITISDRIDKPKGNSPNTTFPSWVDGVDLVLLPDGPLYISTNDLNAFSDDSIVIGTGHAFSDTLALSDAAFVALGLKAEAFDSLFYNIADEASVISSALLATANVSDSLNNWTDVVLTDNAGNPIPPLSDSLTMGDGQNLILHHRLQPTETLSLSDTNLITLGINFGVSDSNVANWNDAAVVAMVIALSVSGADQLVMSDAATKLMNTPTTNYLRRYLNDVVN